MIVDVELEPMSCPNCGITYAAPKDWREALGRRHDRGEKAEWFCPNGHATVYSRDPRIPALERERDRLKQDAARLEQMVAAGQREVRALKAQSRLDHRRTAAGVCPCCHRTFSQLARHMKTKHPEATAQMINQSKARGGIARAAAMTPERRRAVAQAAANKRWHGAANE